MATCLIKYEPHLSDKVRSSEASRFSITKIWCAYPGYTTAIGRLFSLMFGRPFPFSSLILLACSSSNTIEKMDQKYTTNESVSLLVNLLANMTEKI